MIPRHVPLLSKNHTIQQRSTRSFVTCVVVLVLSSLYQKVNSQPAIAVLVALMNRKSEDGSQPVNATLRNLAR